MKTYMKLFHLVIIAAWLASITVGSATAQMPADTQYRHTRAGYPPAPCSKGPNPTACTIEDLQQDLIMTIMRDDKEVALHVLARLGDVNFVNGVSLRTPLSLATQRGQSEIVAALLKKRADPLAVDRNGRPLLYDSIINAYSVMPELRSDVIDCVRMVLEKANRLGRLPTKPPLDASVVFYPGARKPNMELLKLFIAYGAEPNRKGWYWYDGSPLDAAISKGNLEAVRIMIAPGSHITQAELDEKAFEALVKHKAELLAAFRSAGADPKRHINAKPKMLFDAVRSGGSIETLEFLLKNGASPNAMENTGTRMTPLFMALHDPDKMHLLFRYGADPNVGDYNGYTVLAHVLISPRRETGTAPAQASRTDGKISLIKLLLDHKADLNANNGGYGRWGALGHTRREDKEVIAFLIQQGATLSYKVGGPSFTEPLATKHLGVAPTHKEAGPVTITIEFLERDDLALALLTRSGKVDPMDRLALLQATRRGWSEVVQAPLRAGADPNMADAEGLTPLAVAERRKDTVLAKMLVAAGAKPSLKSAKPNYKFEGWSEFDSAVASEIDDIVLFDPPRFSLDLSPSKKEPSFAFNGEQPQNFEEVKCERSTRFEIIANMNTAGSIGVGICSREAKRLNELALISKRHLETLFTQLTKGNVKSDQMDRKKLGLIYENRTDASGSNIHYFPVIVIGHGILFAPTVVLVSEKGDWAIIVQADVMNLCDEGRTMRNQTPLCADTKRAIMDVAQRLFARFNDK